MGSMIPTEYQEVEYIESTGTQWIDTGYIPTLKTQARVIFSPTAANNIGYFGARFDPYRFCCTTYSGGKLFGLNVKNNDWTLNRYSIEANVIYDCEMSNGYSRINNVENTESELTENDWSSVVGTFVLCGKDTLGKIQLQQGNRTQAKWYFCSLAEDNVLICNLLPCYRKSDNEIGMYDAVSKTFFTNSGTGVFLKGNDVSHDRINLLEARRKILLNTPHIEQASGNLLSFNTDVKAALKDCKIYFTPVQEGSGTPSPENVRPIHGWDGVTVTRCGKNLFDYQNLENIRIAASATLRHKVHDYGSISVENGVVTLTRTHLAAGLSFILGKLQAGVTYSLSGTWRTTDGTAYIALLDSDVADNYTCTRKFAIEFANDVATFTPQETGVYEVLIWKTGIASIYASDVQIELGSTATTYEPYQSSTLTIPFPQTIYGGYVDLIKGEVVEEWHKAVLDGENRKVNRGQYTNAGSDVFGAAWVYASPNGMPGLTNTYCESLLVRNGHNSTIPYLFITSNGSLYYVVMCGKISEHPEITTNDQRIDFVNDWLKDNPVTVVYKLATPNTYPLTTQTIKTLKGINNLWSNANGNILVRFWTH